MANQEVEIVAGSYEELLLGYKLVEEDGVYTLQQSFTDHSHTGCVKTVAISRKGVLASGGTDEIVRLLNLRKRTELGSLLEHEGAITCVQFYGSSHLFTASQDKKICIWKSFTWECLRTLRGHKGGVNHVCVHPSGKLALSVGQDKAMQTWNLVRGRSAYITNTKQAGDLVVWSSSGDSYIIVFNNRLDVYCTETASVQASIKSTGRINTVVYLENEVIAYAGEGGDIVFHNIKENKQLSCLKSNTVRVRGLVCTQSPFSPDKILMVSVSSDGMIKVWEVGVRKLDVESQLLTEHNTKFRLTCVAMTPSKVDNSAKTSNSSEQKPTQNTVPVGERHTESQSDSEPEAVAERVSSSTQGTERKSRERKRKEGEMEVKWKGGEMEVKQKGGEMEVKQKGGEMEVKRKRKMPTLTEEMKTTKQSSLKKKKKKKGSQRKIP